MRFKICCLIILFASFATACSRSGKSNEQFSDTNSVYLNDNPDSISLDPSIVDTASLSDSGSTTRMDNNDQGPRVHVGEDTVGKDKKLPK